MTKKVLTSPIPVTNSVGMSFPDALREVINGKKITRLGWDSNLNSYGLLKDTYLQINRDGQFYNWIVNDGDLVSIDWVVLKDN